MGVYTEQHSAADVLHMGRGRDPKGVTAGRRLGGVAIQHPSRVSLGTPAVADADFIVKAATGTELPNAADPGETVTYTTATDGTSPLDAAAPAPVEITLTDGSVVEVWDVRDGADYGRNLVTVATHATAVVAMTVTYSGYDYAKRAMTEVHAITATGTSKTVTGAKAFAYLESVSVAAAADASANTLNVGTGVKLGLPYALHSAADVLAVYHGGAQELVNQSGGATVVAAVATAASGTTGDVRGTVAVNGTLDGSKEVVLWAYFSGCNSQAGLAGVAQA